MACGALFRAARRQRYNRIFSDWTKGMMFYLVTALYVLVCFSMMLVVYLQQGKGGDIASAFGGGSSQAAFGARSGATVLSRATAVCAILFMVGALVLGIIGKRGPGSVLGGRTPLTQPSGPTPSPLAPPARTPAPATPAPAPANNAAPAPAPAPAPAR
jgi:preprotein translocase subunit SecG